MYICEYCINKDFCNSNYTSKKSDDELCIFFESESAPNDDINNLKEETRMTATFDLGSFINSNDTSENGSRIVKIPLSKLSAYHDDDGNAQPFDVNTKDPAFEALKDSIEHNGLIAPITVREIVPNEEYQILNGHRRYAACMQLGYETINALIADSHADSNSYYDKVVDSNIQRSLPSPMELARIFHHYLLHRKDDNDDNSTAEDIAKKFGSSRKTLYRYIKLLSFVKEIQKCFDEGLLPIAQIESLYSLLVAPANEDSSLQEWSEKQQRELAEYIRIDDTKLSGKTYKRVFSLIDENKAKKVVTAQEIDAYVLDCINAEAAVTRKYKNEFFNRLAKKFPSFTTDVTSEQDLEDKIINILLEQQKSS